MPIKANDSTAAFLTSPELFSKFLQQKTNALDAACIACAPRDLLSKLEQIKPSVSKRFTIARGAIGFEEADETIEDDDEDEPEEPLPPPPPPPPLPPPELPSFFFSDSTIFSKMMNESCRFSTVVAMWARVSFAASLARACASAKRSSKKGTTSMERTAAT